MISLTLGGVALEVPTIPLMENIIEGTTDVVTLDGTMNTDFMNLRRGWEINFKVLDETQYDALRAVYNSQFTTFDYPDFSFPLYNITDVPVRMYINDKNIQRDGCQLRDVQVKLIEQIAIYTGDNS